MAWDNGMIADRFRKWCAEKGMRLDARDIQTAFFNYCKGVGKI